MSRRCLAEFLGTFAIVFFGCGSILTQPGNPLLINAVFGLVVMAMIYTVGHISGAHFNPAVTVAFATIGKIPWREVWPYLGVQVAGAVLASGLQSVLVPNPGNFGSTVPSGSFFAAGIVELVLSLFLMLVITSVATDVRVHRALPGLAIGGYVTLAGLFGGPLSGCSMNPARSLGPALFGGALASLPVYLVFPVIGAVLGAKTYAWLGTPDQIT